MPKPSKISVISHQEIGRRLRELRVQRGLTQTELADLLGTGQTAISEVERGNRGLTVQQVVKIAKTLKATPNELLGADNGPESQPLNARLLRRVHRIQGLPDRQQRAMMKLLDAIIESQVAAAS